METFCFCHTFAIANGRIKKMQMQMQAANKTTNASGNSKYRYKQQLKIMMQTANKNIKDSRCNKKSAAPKQRNRLSNFSKTKNEKTDSDFLFYYE